MTDLIKAGDPTAIPEQNIRVGGAVEKTGQRLLGQLSHGDVYLESNSLQTADSTTTTTIATKTTFGQYYKLRSLGCVCVYIYLYIYI